MSNIKTETCPVCGVKIENGDKVIFSSGPAGTRARLWARVCNYVEKPDCINKDTDGIGEIGENDYYRPI
ncbi:MAG: hypothetical protein AB4041_20710 [Microcystaceae cyanobacterium]